MAEHYLATLIQAGALAAQEQYYGKSRELPQDTTRTALTSGEIEFITSRDSFYLASTNDDKWPYIQHRGGPKGFLQVRDPHTLAFADYRGNRQLITTGNVGQNQRVSLFLMDYPSRQRLKLLGEATTHHPEEDGELFDLVRGSVPSRQVERIFTIDIVSYDWNCPQYITPRYTEEEIEERLKPLQRRIAELEAAQPQAQVTMSN